MTTAFVNAHIIDGLGNSYRGHMVVDGEKIAAVGQGDLPSSFKDSIVEDLDGKTLLPGFIDCHVHLRNDGVADPRAQAAADTDAVACPSSGVLGQQAA